MYGPALKNLVFDEDESRDDLAGRLSVLVEPWEDFSALFQYGFSDVERQGRARRRTQCPRRLG